MNKMNMAVFFAALLIIGACAEPRKMLADTEEGKLAEAEEHQRILAELEEVHALRERMMQQGKTVVVSTVLMVLSFNLYQHPLTSCVACLQLRATPQALLLQHSCIPCEQLQMYNTASICTAALSHTATPLAPHPKSVHSTVCLGSIGRVHRTLV